MTRDEVWPTFDAWCLEHGIEPLELPADRWLNLIEYFATRNMDEKKRKEWDNHIASIKMEWIKLKLESTTPKKASVTSGISESGRDGSTGSTQPGQQRERRLPPKPAWYGSRDNATRDSLAAKSLLTSRNGRKRR